MNIIIVGCGKIGTALVTHLCDEKHNISIIDKNKKALEKAVNTNDAVGYCGNGASASLLRAAGIESSDLLIAMTGNDELNIMCCLIARKLGNCRTIARVTNPDYSDELDIIKEELGLALVVNPDKMVAEEIARLVRRPFVDRIDVFAGGLAELLTYRLDPGNKLCGLKIMDIARSVKLRFLVCVVERNSEVFIPNGDFELKEGDLISCIVSGNNEVRLSKELKLHRNKVSKCMIAGGGDISYYLAQILEKKSSYLTIIEKNEERSAFLADHLDKALIINEDVINTNILEEEGIKGFDAFVALTNMDDTNILLAMYAGRYESLKCVYKQNRRLYGDISKGLNLGSIVSTPDIVSDNIISYTRALTATKGNNIETLYKILDGRAEALEFLINSDLPFLNRPLMELNIKNSILVAAIIRGNTMEIPNGKSVLKKGDRVIIVTTHTGLHDISNML